MKVCVAGLWHLGLVTAACVATRFETVALDFDQALVESIRLGQLPIFEPGLDELLSHAVREKRLLISADPAFALRDADIVWIAYDTPVDDSDAPDTEFVFEQIKRLIGSMRDGSLLLISTQVPVGTCARIEAEIARSARTGIDVAYSPENLRLGNALDVFMNADRVIAGSRRAEARAKIDSLVSPFTASVVHMSIESAEMTKHALNAYLATSLTFINELSALCELFGADVLDVQRALKSDGRIGQRAYLDPGPGYAGGTLGRDVYALNALATEKHRESPLLGALARSNALSMRWPEERLAKLLELRGATVAILGLTYKPETNTLRRSQALEFGESLSKHGATVKAFDPAIDKLPEPYAGVIQLAPSAASALSCADAVFVATAWGEFKTLPAAIFLENMRKPIIIDPRRVLSRDIQEDARMNYHAMGLPPCPTR